MTDARMAALEAVAEAARDVLRNNSGDKNVARLMLLAMQRALLRLDALPAPAPQPVGEVVEVRASVFHSVVTGRVIVREHDWGGELSARTFPHIATISARVPLPTVPIIAATVERGE